ncbi:MAG: S8 family serine peptidase, partial [Firmicutes bacterium]|nr:S8 family serine peptidase [Bacillota bacterium]
HDGKSLFEGYINEMALRQRSSVAVSSGNEGASGHHYRGKIGQGEEVTVEFTVAVGVGDIFLTGWKNYVDRMNFELITPDNTSTGVINYNSDGMEAVLGGSQVLFVLGRPSPYNISQEVYIGIKNAQSGIWRLKINGTRIVDGGIDIWLPVTEAVTRDTAFLSPEPETTLTMPSSALNVITVGGYDPINESIASFSGRGYTRVYCVVKPDIAAPAVNIVSAKVGGGRDVYTGTSFAAPFVAGMAALLMQWGIVQGNDVFMYGQRLKAAIRSAARRRDNMIYPNDEWGYGILDINNTIGQLIRIGGVKIQAEEELENAIYSEDYIDLITPFNEQIQNILDENANIQYFKFFSNQYAILFVPRNYYRIFLENDGKYIVNTESKVFGLMQSDELINSGVIQTRNNLGLRGAGTLVGILDTGINYKDEEFLYEDNTSKIAYIWDQTKRGEGNGENVRYGREYSRQEIDAALNGGEDIGVNDENGHGTLLAKLSAGRISGAAPDAELVIVKLKEAKQSIREDNYIFTDAVGFESSDIMTAVNYLYSVSQRLGKPISICIGLGTNTGSHSGYSVIESFIGQIALKNGVIVCAATGNEGNAEHHSYGTIEDGTAKSIEISVGERERGFIVDIWTYIPDKIVLSITSPLWETIRNIQILPNYSQNFKLPLSESEITITYYSSLPEGELELYEIKMLNPTSGIWQINITGEEVDSGFYHSWLPISDFLRSNTIFLSPDSYTTLTIPSSGTSIIAVGGYNAADGRIYPPSGRGPSTIGKLEPLL